MNVGDHTDVQIIALILLAHITVVVIEAIDWPMMEETVLTLMNVGRVRTIVLTTVTIARDLSPAPVELDSYETLMDILAEISTNVLQTQIIVPKPALIL